MQVFSLKGGLLAILTISIPLTALCFGIQPDFLNVGTAPDDYSTVIMVISALPWVLAADLLGIFPSVLLAVVSGLFFAVWGTHSLFTPIETGLAALIFNIILRQKNMPGFRHVSRHPFVAAILASFALILVMVAGNFFAAEGTFAARLDAALIQVWGVWLARVSEILIAGIIAELVFIRTIGSWQNETESRPSVKPDVNYSKQNWGAVPFIAVMLFVFITADWIFASNFAKEIINEQIEITGAAATNSLADFYLGGQETVEKLAAKNLLKVSVEELPAALEAEVKRQLIFHQIMVVDASGNIASAYPAIPEGNKILSKGELQRITESLADGKNRVFSLPPRLGGASEVIGFIAPIKSEDGKSAGLVVGHSDFQRDFLNKAGLDQKGQTPTVSWEWWILDERDQIIVNPNPQDITSGIQEEGLTAENLLSNPDCLSEVYPVSGTPWKLVLSAPISSVQKTAFEIAGPQMGLLLVLGLVTILIVQSNSRRVAKTIRGISMEASKFSPRSREQNVRVDNHDEVSRLKAAFEEMNANLNDRLGELNKLLTVSQKIASSLQVEENMHAILEAALVSRVGSARIVLDNILSGENGEKGLLRFGSGPATEELAYLDDQIFDLMRYQDMLVVRNTLRIRRLDLPEGEKHPGALVAFAINHENHYHGALWAAYEQPYEIPEEEIRYLNMLAGDATIAAANYHLFTTAEVGKQRLEAVLAATPEPVLVIDEHENLLLLNPAAIILPGLVSDTAPGQNIKDIIINPDLRTVLQNHKGDQVTTSEIKLQNERIYHVSVSSIIADGEIAGKVCNLRDITHYKETDSLKSDFVATVSHDLRSPLTLMRGYTTMMQMVGELNEQQTNYTGKILAGIGNMERLVNNVLDLEKIEMNRGLKREKIVVVELLEQIIETLRPQSVQKKVDLKLEQPINPAIFFEGDRDLLHLALINLADNAIKFTSVGGKVDLGAEIKGESIIFSVKDDGIGIAPLDQPKLFDRYFRSSRREAVQQRGSGLGLTIVKSIADLHKGKVWVDSQLGKGSSFYLEVPM